MKVREKYNMKKALEAKSDWDFTIFMSMRYETIDGCVYRLKTPRLIPVHRFTLFAVTVIEAPMRIVLFLMQCSLILSSVLMVVIL